MSKLTQKTLVNELNTLRVQALELADKAMVLIDKVGAPSPTTLKNQEVRRVIDRINAKIFNKK